MATKKKLARRSTASKSAKRRGPKPDVLKIEGDWKEAVKKSLQKRKPPEGWPK